MNKTSVLFSQAKSLIKEGDILLFRTRGIVPFLIRRAGEGQYSHVAIASAHRTRGSFFWECVEFREGSGGRSVLLERQVILHDGLIDVYRPISPRINISFSSETGKVSETRTKFNGREVTKRMRRMTGLPYGWKRLWWIAKHKLFGLRLLYSMSEVTDDSIVDDIYPVCSTAIAACFRKAGFDLVKNRSDQATEPSDIARSTSLQYLFTLKAVDK
jgi:hypothetical protein